MDLPTLEKEFDARIILNESSGQFQLFGTQDALSTLLQHLNSLLRTVDTSAVIPCGLKELQYLKKFVLARIGKEGVSISVKSSSIVLEGKAADISIVKATIQAERNAIVVTKVSKPINYKLFRALSAHLEALLKDRAVVECTSAKPKHSNKGDDDDDGDGSSSDSMSASDSSSVSGISEGKDDDAAFTKRIGKYDRQVEISAWHSSDPATKAEVLSKLNTIGNTKDVYNYQPHEISAFRKIGFGNIEKKFGVNLFNNRRRRCIFISGFSQSIVQQAMASFKQSVEVNALLKRTIFVELDKLHFLKLKKQVFLQEFKKEFNLRTVELDKGTSSNSDGIVGKIILEGNPSRYILLTLFRFIRINSFSFRVAQAEQEMKQFVQEILIHKSILLKKDVANPDVQKLKLEIQEDHDASLKWKLTHEGFKISVCVFFFPFLVAVFDYRFKVTALATANWEAINVELNKLKLEPKEWVPSNYQKLSSLIFGEKKLDLYALKKEYNLKELYFDKNKGVVRITAKNPDDIVATCSALEGLLHNQQIVSQSVTGVSKIPSMILLRRGSQSWKRLEDLQKQHSVSIITDRATDTMKVRGPKASVESATVALRLLLDSFLPNIRTETKELPSYLATKFSEENWKFTKDFFMHSGVYIEFPEWNKASVMMELSLTNGNVLVQIVSGNITDEPTECIVNAANEQLQHNGGVAQHIAKKAGERMTQECAAIIAKQGNVPTGKIKFIKWLYMYSFWLITQGQP